jgi:hypothetical protein
MKFHFGPKLGNFGLAYTFNRENLRFSLKNGRFWPEKLGFCLKNREFGLFLVKKQGF